MFLRFATFLRFAAFSRFAACAVLLIVLSGCAANPARQALLDAGPGVELEQVAFFPQDEYQCGPAALATVLASDGIAVTPQQLAPRLYIPDRRGSLQAEMLATTRSHGRVPYVLADALAPMLEEVQSGRPVLLLQNLGLNRWPVWHYAVLIGFDADAGEFLLRSGTIRRQQSPARRFLASWERGGRWAMVAAPPGEPPVSADATGWLRAVAPFESTGNLELAAEGYQAAVARWPEEPLAWAALGNVRYLQGDLLAAEQAYSRALGISAGLWTVRNNLVRTLVDRGCPGLAQPWVNGAGSPPAALASVWQRTLDDLAAAGVGVCAGGS
ncbi:MAG: PA2778 family cysteine peptidase [Pseudomonadales bacterium]